MRTSSTEIWDLIGTLSPTEKRYCRVAIDRGQLPATCVFLWETGQQDDPGRTEDQLTALHPGLFPSRSAVSKAKERLLNFLLDILLDYHERIMPHREAYQILLRAQVLRTKGLVRHALRRLEKAEKLIHRYEIQELMEPLLRLKLQMLAEKGTNQELQRFSADLDRTFRPDRLILEERMDVMEQMPGWLIGIRNPGRQTDEPPAGIPGLQPLTGYRSFHAQSWLHTVRGGWFSVRHDREAALYERRAILELFERYPQMVLSRLAHYASNLYNVVSSLTLSGQFEEAAARLRELERLPQDYARFPHKERLEIIRLTAHSARYVLAIRQGDFEQAQAVYLAVELPPRPRPESILAQHTLVFHYNFALLQYRAGELKASVRHLNAFLSLYWPRFRPETYRACRIMEAVAHLETGNLDWLAYRLNNNLQELRRRKQTKGFDYPFFQALLRIIRLPEEKQKAELEDLKGRLTDFPPPPDPVFIQLWRGA